jgi:hypothetical protein
MANVSTSPETNNLTQKWQSEPAVLQIVRNQLRESVGQTNGTNENTEKLREIWVQKHTNGSLAEAVIVNGLPFFLKVKDYRAELVERIETPTASLLPPDKAAYLNKGYEFTSLADIQDYVNRARDESLDSLYGRVKGIFAKYIDADNDHLTICAADTIFTYFQDKIGQTHYLIFVGDNGTGKSNNLVVFQYLGYRPLFDTSITPANIYSYLGSIEEGQGIVLEDEADNIDSNFEKMKIYKVGYNAGKKVSRMDLSFGRKQQSYWTYCFKAFSAERQPDNDKAKGFNERTFVIRCKAGYPTYDISEVINPAGDEKYQQLLEELLDSRKLLLAYRMLHYGEPIPDIDLTIHNREKQLCKPLLRLFQHSKCRYEISETLAKLLAAKRERKSNTLEAKLYRIIKGLTTQYGLALENGLVWTTIKEELNGEEIQGKSQSCYTVEHGQISLRQVITILTDKFGAKRGHDGKSRLLMFTEDMLERLQRTYELADTIEIIPNGTNAFNDSGDAQESLDVAYTAKSDAPSPESKDGSNDVDGISNLKPENARQSDPLNTDASEEPLKSLESLGEIQCPYDGCIRTFRTPAEVIDHSIAVHGNYPITSKLAERGYKV